MTTEKILSLRPDVLDGPTLVDVAVLEVTMLWPDNLDKRAGALQAIEVKHLTDREQWLPAASANEMSAFVRLVQSAPRFDELASEAKDAVWRGTVAGFILLNAVGLIEAAPERANLSSLKKKIAEAMRKKFKLRVSERTIDNTIWKTFRPVAAYWAAWLITQSPVGRFPCSPADLGSFLGAAEAFRRLGETHRTPQSPSPILQAGEAIIPDPSIPIPQVGLSFEAPSEEVLQIERRRLKAIIMRAKAAQLIERIDRLIT